MWVNFKLGACLTLDLFLQGEELAGEEKAWLSAFGRKDALERRRITFRDASHTAKSRGTLARLFKVLASVSEMTVLFLFSKACTSIYFYYFIFLPMDLPPEIGATMWLE